MSLENRGKAFFWLDNDQPTYKKKLVLDVIKTGESVYRR